MEIRTKKINNDALFGNILFFLNQGKKARLKITGRSMLPFMDMRYDEVILEPVNNFELRVGSIVLAHINNKSYILHRIIKIENDIITLMGDGNITQTEQCYKNQIKAFVRIRIRENKETDMTSPKFMKKVNIWLKLTSLRRFMLLVYNVFTDKNYISNKLKK